jgi:hypothetical protein
MSVSVKIKYNATGGTPTGSTWITVDVYSKNPTESEIAAAIRKKNPQMNFIILEIKK